MIAKRVIVFLLIFSIVANPSRAWNSSGHMQVAMIAWEQLTPEVRTKMVAILKKHPRFAVDFEDQRPPSLSPADLDEWYFIKAATWPDVIRKVPQWHHGTWHYINEPFFPTSDDEHSLSDQIHVNRDHNVPNSPNEIKTMNAVQALKYNLGRLKSASTSDSEKAVALCWVLHVAGDLHQPLHTTAMFSVALSPEGDRGGNLIHVGDGGKNLHSVWDGMVGAATHFKSLKKQIVKLFGNSALVNMAKNDANQTDPVAWVKEGQDLCKESVYTDDVLGELALDESGHYVVLAELPDGYLEDAKDVARKRIIIAGFRLAELLQ